MNLHRSTFFLYLALWLILVLVPALCALLSGSGWNEVSAMGRETHRNVIAPIFSGGIPQDDSQDEESARNSPDAERNRDKYGN